MDSKRGDKTTGLNRHSAKHVIYSCRKKGSDILFHSISFDIIAIQYINKYPGSSRKPKGCGNGIP